MNFGNDTVVLTNYTAGTKDPFGVADLVPHSTTERGGRFRPLSATEVKALTDANVEMWKWTALPSPQVLAATTTSQITYGTKSFEIEGGIQVFTDVSGRPFKVTVLCKRLQTQTA